MCSVAASEGKVGQSSRYPPKIPKAQNPRLLPYTTPLICHPQPQSPCLGINVRFPRAQGALQTSWLGFAGGNLGSFDRPWLGVGPQCHSWFPAGSCAGSACVLWCLGGCRTNPLRMWRFIPPAEGRDQHKCSVQLGGTDTLRIWYKRRVLSTSGWATRYLLGAICTKPGRVLSKLWKAE